MYDVIIVGCGVAGGYLASQLRGLDVLVLEKDNNVILKDSGLVSSHFRQFFPKRLIKSKIKEMRAVSPSGITFTLGSEKPFAYILKRKGFSRHLRSISRKNADVKYESVKKVTYSDDCVSVVTSGGEYKSKLVIGCDGTFSIVRRTLGIKLPGMHPGIFVRTKKNLQHKVIDVYFNKYFSPEFFSWVIPQINEYGIITSVSPMESLDYFKRKINLPEGSIYSSFIPVGYCKSYAFRTLLIGDACGHVKPLTGGGIMFSLRAARHAAAAIKSAVGHERYDATFLSGYEHNWKSEISKEIKLQLVVRRVYKKFTNRNIDNLFVKFGYDISKIEYFDYDKLSTLAWGVSKIELLKYFLPRLGLFF